MGLKDFFKNNKTLESQMSKPLVVDSKGFINLNEDKVKTKYFINDAANDENIRPEVYDNYLLDTIRWCDEDKPFAFISYSSKDKRKVWDDIIELQIKGYNIWIDKNMKETDHSWFDTAKKALSNENCKLVIFYLSESSIKSEPCLKELNYSQNEVNNNIPWIVVEAKEKYNDIINNLIDKNEVVEEMIDKYVYSSKKRIKHDDDIAIYFEKLEKNLIDNGIKPLSEEELYSKAVKMINEDNQEYSAIAILDYCYSRGYLPAIMLRAFIQEKPIFRDYFTNEKDKDINNVEKLIDREDWLKLAKRFKQDRYIEQAAAFYSAYALATNDQEAYKEATNLWGHVLKTDAVLFNTCIMETQIQYFDGDWELTRENSFSYLFDLEPLSLFNIDFCRAINRETGKSTLAYDITPNGNRSSGKVHLNYNLSDKDKELAQIVINYGFNYGWHELYGSTAGYYAAQIAIWGRFANPQIDPASLVIKSNLSVEQKELAEKVRTFASTLYNDHTTQNHGLSFKYNRTVPQSEYILNEGTFDLYDVGNELYYRSEKMSVTTYGTAGNLSYTVNVDGGAYVTDGSEDLSAKKTSITLGGNNGNVFYVFVPADRLAGVAEVKIHASYNYLSSMTWDYDSGQRYMSDYTAHEIKEYSLKLIKKDRVWAKKKTNEELKQYKGKIKIKTTGIGVTNYCKFNINGESLYTLVGDVEEISGAFIYLLRETGEGNYGVINDEKIVTAKGLNLDVKFSLKEIKKDGVQKLSSIKVCEVKAPIGYELFDGVPEKMISSNIVVQCLQGIFKKEDADENNIISKNLTLNHEAKKFLINIINNQTNNTYTFGLYTTKDIKVTGKDDIPANSLVAYGQTDNEGKLTLKELDYFLPADQNYILKEVNNKDIKLIVNGIESIDNQVELDVLDKATVDGYLYDVEIVEKRG